jgi:YidC/Oxa1 family membrane protein insertase
MDRKGFIGVVVCILAYVALQLFVVPRFTPPPRPVVAGAASAMADTNAPTLSAPPVNAPADADASSAPATQATTAPAAPAQLSYLENGEIKVTLTNEGAAVQSIDLKKQAEGDKDVVLNAGSSNDVMAVSGWPGSDSAAFKVQATPAAVTYTGALGNGVTWKRTYTLGKDYILAVQDTLTNTGSAEAVLPVYTVSVGRAKPLLVKGKYQPISSQYTGAGWLTTSKYHLTTVRAFDPGGWPWSRTPGHDVVSSTTIDPNPLRWLAVQDQFFAVLLTPDPHHPIAQASFQCFNPRAEDGSIPSADEPKIAAFAQFPELRLPAGKATVLNYTLYTGPREYSRLNAMGDNQGELMNYDGFLPFSLLIVPMLFVLHTFNSWFHSYGVAIILLTLVIKAVTWPLQSFANRSGKRMQALAPKIKELQAKYKEQPEKVSSETFSLYKDYGVNPFGGCLPAFIQMPVFFSLYYMLQNAVELRGRHFLWVKDLTQPDTIFSTPLGFSFFGISHLTINPLPVMVTMLMMVMMRMTPQMGDPQQQKIAQFMPLFFLFLFYNFAAALSLYYVINNAVAIIQIYRNLRKPLPDLKRKPKKA